MPGLSRMSGTPWHVGRFTRAEGDERRHKSRCKYYLKENRKCCKNGGDCSGSAHCMSYEENPPEVKAEHYQNYASPQIAATKQSEAKAEKREPIRMPKIGATVFHKIFGKGVVVEIEGERAKLDFGKEKPTTLDMRKCIEKHIVKYNKIVQGGPHVP